MASWQCQGTALVKPCSMTGRTDCVPLNNLPFLTSYTFILASVPETREQRLVGVAGSFDQQQPKFDASPLRPPSQRVYVHILRRNRLTSASRIMLRISHGPVSPSLLAWERRHTTTLVVQAIRSIIRDESKERYLGEVDERMRTCFLLTAAKTGLAPSGL